MPTNFYSKMNEELGGYGADSYGKVEHFLPVTKLLLAAFDKLPPVPPAKLFRGVKMNYKAILKTPEGGDAKVGDVLQWNQFTSSSTSQDVLKDPEFLGVGEAGTVFQFIAVEGVNMKPYSKIEKEDEVVLPPGSRFVIDLITPCKDGVTEVRMRQIHGATEAQMQALGRPRFSAAAAAAATAATAARRKGTQCTRPSPSGGNCKNTAIKATLFCKGHTCPIQGCTSGKSTKMETCPEHVHAQAKRRGGARSAQPRPESGEVFYDSFGSAGANAGAVAAAPQGGSNAIYAQSTKATVRLNKKKKQQQQQQHAADANATYATPMRPVPEQDYVALNEMPSNAEASAMYDVPTASAADAGVSVPEPTKVGNGMVVLGASANQMDGEDDDDDLYC